MGSAPEVCATADEVMKEEVIFGSWNLICKVGDEEAKNVAGPATPEENAEHNHPSSSPPPSSPNATTVETPRETLFDSFAHPGSDKLLLAPRHRKYREDSRNHVVRRLNFTSLIKDFDKAAEEDSDEERLFEIVYATIMDAIFAERAAAASEGTPPKSTQLLTGVADTCPPAPIKSARRQRCFDKEICKKLQF